MKVLNNKIYFELLEDSEQPQKTIFQPNADMLKLCRVIDVGQNVEYVSEGDIITIYVTSISMLDSTKGLCTERDVIFNNSIPQKGKVHIGQQKNNELSVFKSGKVLSSNSQDIEKNDEVYYKPGQSHVLPDNTEIISETQIFYSK